MESPCPRLPDRARPPLLSTNPSAGRLRVRRRAEPVVEPTAPPSPPPVAPPPSQPPELVVPMPRAALLAAALVLAISSRGDVVVLALLLAFGAGRRMSGLASASALVAALVRWGSPSLGAIAGAQAVLGPAGWTGSAAAVASAWFGACALVLAAGMCTPASAALAASRHERRQRAQRALAASMCTVSPFAIAAADVVVGPAPGGALALRVLASAVAVVATTLLARWRSMPWLAVGCGVLALACAGIAR